MGQENGTFASYVIFYRVNSDQEAGRCTLRGSVVYDLMAAGTGFCAVTEEQLCFIDGSGVMTAAYDYGGDYLRRSASAATAMPLCCWVGTVPARSTEW